MLGRPAAAVRRAAQGAANAAHGRAADRQGVELVQLLGEGDVVEANVGGRQERDDLRAQRGGQSARRRLAAAPMHEALQAVATEPRLESLELAHGSAATLGPFLVCDLPASAALTSPARGTSFLLIVKV